MALNKSNQPESRAITKVGIIGGSGLDNPDIIQERKERTMLTPFGKHSDTLIEGKIKDVHCVLLARHGRDHSIMPSNINYQANIWALKEIGCTHILATTACGSLREDIHPGELAFPDQFIDRTTKRKCTFYDGEMESPKGVCHIPMHTPFCPHMRKLLKDTAEELGFVSHDTATMITIEGPRFSTKAESLIFRSWNADLINMTTVPEVVLAKEAGIPYASIAMATDYDCWYPNKEAVNVENVLAVLKENVHKATELILNVVPKLEKEDWTERLKQSKDEAESAVMPF